MFNIKKYFSAAGFAVLLFALTFTLGSAEQPEWNFNNLEGTWWVTVTQVNCATGSALPIPQFSSLLSFAKGGTVSETTSNPAFQPGQRSSGYGTWKRVADDKYTGVDVAFILFTSPLFTQGTQRIDHKITVAEDGESFKDSATVKFFDRTGAVLTSGCADATAKRLK